MSSNWSIVRRQLRKTDCYPRNLRATSRCYNTRVLQENDVVILEKRHPRKRDQNKQPVLTKPLKHGERAYTFRGYVQHSDLIGKSVRDIVTSSEKKAEFRIQEASLGDYVNYTTRRVTPIYPADANLLVSLLDLHPGTPGSENNERMEIFEAGTGHGALTLHLARAIHAANPFPPPLPLIEKSKRAHRPSGESSGELPLATISEETEKSNSERDDAQNAYNAYLPSRRAIVQTLDISELNSRHAEDVVRNFRRGMYYHNVDFHVGTINEYISTRLSESTEPFLSHAILDLPDTYSFMELMAKAIKPNGSVLEFCPNVTQIAKTTQMVKEQKLPWALEKVLEIGMGAGVGGRPWSVRAVKPRALLRAEAEARQAEAEQTDTEESEDSEAAESAEEVTSSEVDSGWEMVCRPSVGMMIGGGGFVGQWRRTSRE